MGMFSSTPVTPAPAAPQTYDDVIAEVTSLTASLDAMSAAFAANTVANDAQIATLQAASASDVAGKAKTDDLSAKLKALLPPPVVVAPVVPASS